METPHNFQPRPSGDQAPLSMNENSGDREQHSMENQRPSMEGSFSSHERHHDQDSPASPLKSPSSITSDARRLTDRSRRLLEHFEQDIFMSFPPYNHDEEASQPVTRQLVVNFAGLQRMRMSKLQIELANRVMSMHFKEEEPEDWESLLVDYSEWCHFPESVTAVRDYDYIQTCVNRRGRDPFILSSSRQLEARILELELLQIPLELREKKGEWSSIDFRAPRYSANATRTKLSKEETLRQTLQRLGMAVVGGAFLIGPMWLMVLKNQMYTTLITTTAFVFGFGLVLSIVPTFVDGVRLGMETVMSVTAAYAAVLVVFVGTTTPTTTSGN